MKLSIITINRNNAGGIEKTLRSLNVQTCKEFEHIIIDGASTDNSVEVIRQFEDTSIQRRCISEPDKGIYNAMNKGIRMATGEYVQFLNSGDCLASSVVVEKMLNTLQVVNQESYALKQGYCPILYGNMIKTSLDGKQLYNRDLGAITMLTLYNGTLNHSPAYIRRDLFEKYGYYDESLKIVSDWKWYLKAIILGGEKPVYTDVDVTLFDMNGISEMNKALNKTERKQVLSEMFPAAVLVDYEKWAFPINQMKRLQRYPWAYKCVWFLERCLFKWEKLKIGKYGKV